LNSPTHAYSQIWTRTQNDCRNSKNLIKISNILRSSDIRFTCIVTLRYNVSQYTTVKCKKSATYGMKHFNYINSNISGFLDFHYEPGYLSLYSDWLRAGKFPTAAGNFSLLHWVQTGSGTAFSLLFNAYRGGGVSPGEKRPER